MSMQTQQAQKEKAALFRLYHQRPPMLVLPNAWDAASARILEQVGFQAIATTSSGVAAALGYSDGQEMGRDMLVETTSRITRVVAVPVTVDIEAGYGASIPEVLQTVRAVIEAGAVGFNIEDSLPRGESKGETALVEVSGQVELIRSLRDLSASMDVPFVINARVDAFLFAREEPADQIEQAVSRANAYLRAGADCVYPIGVLKNDVTGKLVKAIDGPVNILGGPGAPDLSELRELGVARVSFADRLMRSAMGHLRAVANELLERGTYIGMASAALASAEFRTLFASTR